MTSRENDEKREKVWDRRSDKIRRKVRWTRQRHQKLTIHSVFSHPSDNTKLLIYGANKPIQDVNVVLPHSIWFFNILVLFK